MEPLSPAAHPAMSEVKEEEEEKEGETGTVGLHPRDVIKRLLNHRGSLATRERERNRDKAEGNGGPVSLKALNFTEVPACRCRAEHRSERWVFFPVNIFCNSV